MKNQKLSRRDFLRLSAGTAAGALLVACAPPTASVVQVTPAAAPVGPVQLRLQRFFGDCTDEYKDITELEQGRGECGIFQVMTNKWNAEHPDMMIETLLVDWPGYDRLNAQFAADDPPEIVIMHGHYIPNYGSRDLLVPLDSIFETEGIDVNDFINAARDYVTYEGKILGLPWDVHGDLWHLNIGVWKEAGLVDSEGKPQIPKNTAEFMAAADKVKAIGKTFLDLQQDGLNGTVWPWLGFVYQQGGSPFSADLQQATVDTPEGLAALEFMYSWSTNGYITPRIGYDDAEERFLRGQNAGWITGTWAVDFYSQQTELDAELKEYMVVNFPQLFGKPGAWSGSHCWVMPTRTKPDQAKIEAIGKFFKYLNDNNSNWARTGHLPVRKSVIDSAEYRALPHRAEYTDFAESAVAWPRVPFASALESIMDEEIQKVWIGDKTPKEALTEAQKRIDDFIKHAI